MTFLQHEGSRQQDGDDDNDEDDDSVGTSEAHPRCQATYTLAPVGAVLFKILYFLHSSRDNTYTYTYVTVRSCACLCRQDIVIQVWLVNDNYDKFQSLKLGCTCVFNNALLDLFSSNFLVNICIETTWVLNSMLRTKIVVKKYILEIFRRSK